MNCLILVLLLLCCGNDGGCQDSGFMCGNGRMSDRRCGGSDRDRGRDRNMDCGCQDRDRSSNDGCDRDRDRDNEDCGCRTESRFDTRPFISYPGSGSTCGCEESRSTSDRN